MTSESTVKGLWWLPDNPAKKLPGHLTYSPTGGAELNLFGYFFDKVDDRSLARELVVWGETANGEQVTLFNCHTSNLQTHFPGGTSATMSSYHGVIGGHFEAPSAAQFCQVTAEMSDLREWAWTTGIKTHWDDSTRTETISVQCPPDVHLGEFDGIRVDLGFTRNSSHSSGECRIREDCGIVLKSNTLLPVEKFDRIASQIQHFVALGVGRPVYRLSTVGQIDKPKFMAGDLPVHQNYSIIRKVGIEIDIRKPRHPHEMLFTLRDLQPKPDKFVGNYLGKIGNLHSVCDLYFSTLYNPDMFLEQRFLSLAHAVEGYHRAMVGGKYQADQEYEKGLMPIFLNVIPKDLDAGFRESLKGKLKYLHEFSLRKQIQDVLDRHDDLLNRFLGDPKAFGSKIADKRNSLTHPNPSAGENEDWVGLWLMGQQLSLLIVVCLLDELGFLKEQIRVMINRSKHAIAIHYNR